MKVGKMVAKLPESHSALTYDDVLLIPGYSDIPSRHDVSLEWGELKLKTPFISANMDTITEENTGGLREGVKEEKEK